MYMYTYVDIHIYIYNTYINVNVIVRVYIRILYIYNYIYISQPTPKFAKHTRCEQVDRDVNIPHPKPLIKNGKKKCSLPVAWRRRRVLK